MKQKKCPQCKNLISVSSPTCLYCGRPNKFVTNAYVKSKWNKEYSEKKINLFGNPIFKFAIILLIILIITIISLYR